MQATCHGADNTAMVDAVQAAGGRARGIATVRPDVTDTELRRLDDAGVRGVRFNFVKRLVDTSPKEDLATIAKKIAPLGWHVVIYFEAADLAGPAGLLHRPARPAGRRPHGPPRRDPARRRRRSSAASCGSSTAATCGSRSAARNGSASPAPRP